MYLGHKVSAQEYYNLKQHGKPLVDSNDISEQALQNRTQLQQDINQINKAIESLNGLTHHTSSPLTPETRLAISQRVEQLTDRKESLELARDGLNAIIAEGRQIDIKLGKETGFVSASGAAIKTLEEEQFIAAEHSGKIKTIDSENMRTDYPFFIVDTHKFHEMFGCNQAKKSTLSSQQKMSQELVMNTIASQFENTDFKKFIEICSSFTPDNYILQRSPMGRKMDKVNKFSQIELLEREKVLGYAIAMIIKSIITPGDPKVEACENQSTLEFIDAYNDNKFPLSIKDAIANIFAIGDENLTVDLLKANSDKIIEMKKEVLEQGIENFFGERCNSYQKNK